MKTRCAHCGRESRAACCPRKECAEAGFAAEKERLMVLPVGPTRHPPGSAEKIEVMAARELRGLPLWHPDDFRADEDGPGFPAIPVDARKLARPYVAGIATLFGAARDEFDDRQAC